MKNLSFGKKLLFLILGVTSLVFGLTIFFISSHSYKTAEADIELYIKESAGKYAAQIQNNVNQSVILSKSIAVRFEEALNNNNRMDEIEVMEYFKSLLKNNPSVIGIWFKNKKRDQLFDVNVDSRNKNGYDETGQFNPYVVRANGIIKVQPGSPYDENLAWVKGPINKRGNFVTKPYLYNIGGRDIMMTTIAIPINYGNEIIGSIGVDISLKELSDIVNRVKIFDNGYGFVVDSYGSILSHPNTELLSKNVLDVSNNDENYTVMLDKAKYGKGHKFFKLSHQDNMESLYYTQPFEILNTDQQWVFGLSAPKVEYLEDAIFIRNLAITLSSIGILLIGLVVILAMRKLNSNLKEISLGLESFFAYLNKESATSKPINIDSGDEFGLMAKSINSNISKVGISIDLDNKLINDVKSVVNTVGKGVLNKRVSVTTTTQTLNELKELLNNMLDNLEVLVGTDLNVISTTLSKYIERDFRNSLPTDTSGKIGNEINAMNNMIVSMLRDNHANGNVLMLKSNELSANVLTLSNNATSQAASLEESAASIEEISSNIEQTSQKAQEMLMISNDTKQSAVDGKVLANDTAKSMDDINNTVISINEAITVIDKIAFQTNILSLNAAVEAATAGEAGKGFAVVAQEVRNLASRSAEAAKEIKSLVETATVKTNEGKSKSHHMINGFKVLEDKILETNNLIDDVTNAAKEQSYGMSQITDAISQLDQFTQENASVADKTNDIAKDTSDIAVNAVESVSKNKFNK